MKQVCLLCNRVAADSNLYCQETFCPAEMSPSILEFGEWLGDIEIVRPIVILRSAVLYEAIHQKQRVLLKVAHPGPEHKERLKRETEFLREVYFSFGSNPNLPKLLPPEAFSSLKRNADAHGKTMLRGHLLYYALFEYFEGESLRDVLTKNSQLWLRHVGWIVMRLANAVATLHSKGLFHYGLSPESLLVHFDEKSNLPHILLFDLGIVTSANGLSTDWYKDFVFPAYLAPEFIGASTIRPNYRTDVYGLGLILYELLVGEPTYPFQLRNDTEIFRLIQNSDRVQMNRIEDVKAVAEIALKAVQIQPDRRQESAQVLSRELQHFFGAIPKEKESRLPALNTTMLILAASLAATLLVLITIIVLT